MSASPAPPPPAGGSMMFMMLFMVMMTFLLLSGDFRTTLGNFANPYLSPWLPDEKWFILTVFVLGSISMFTNTILRNFFTDPIAQAHIAHRQGQVRKMMNEGRVGRDPILIDKAQTMQQHMMPEQLKVQMGAMKPMMFTMIFIIAVFSWMGAMVENFRVDYVSLPWMSEWDMIDGRFLFFPAWICAYICMSAPLGRIVDRHIKLYRYRAHPLVLAGDTIKEPLLELISTSQPKSRAAQSREMKARQRRRHGPRKTESSTTVNKDSKHSKKVEISGECPECGSGLIERDGPSLLRCQICRHEWR